MLTAICKTRLLQFFADGSLNVRSDKLNGIMYIMILNSVSDEFYNDMVIEYLDGGTLQYANTFASMITNGLKCIGIDANRNSIIKELSTLLKDIEDRDVRL